jgi:S1-C subfamily serine protease
VADQLLASGRVSRGYLGLAVQPVRLPEPLQLGLVVVKLEADGPAEQAGLLLGDILTALDGQDLTDPADILAALGGERVGKPIEVRLLRGGKPTTVAVTVGERPARRGR